MKHPLLKNIVSHLPNILSGLRILLSIALAFTGSAPAPFFFVLYLICGLTDILDGWVARRFHLESSLGARLDSLGDLVFWAVVLFLALPRMRAGLHPSIIIILLAVLLLRLANALITRLKFRQWGMLHTLGNKTAGLLLFLFIPFWLLMDPPSCTAAVLLGAVALLSALEEGIILLTSREYHPDRKSIFIQIK